MESARAGIVVRVADAPITAKISTALRSHLIRLRAKVAAGVAEGDIAVRSWEVALACSRSNAARK
jgi:hypothetical protein